MKPSHSLDSIRLDRRTFLAALGTLAACRPAQARADWVLDGGAIYTGRLDLPVVESLAIQGDRILAAGTSADVATFKGPQTRTVALEGRTALPGINDSHVHALNWALSRPPFNLNVGYPTVRSIADIATLVGQRAQELPAGSWILGRGWDQPYLEEGRAPTRQDLDAVAPDHPVLLTEFSGHAAWANSAALRAAGVDRHTVPPEGGVIVKDADGEPTGVLFEGAAWQVREAAPTLGDADRDRALQSAATLLFELGITSITDPFVDLPMLRAYERIAGPGFPRTQLLLHAGTSLEALTPLLDESVEADPLQLRLAGFKIMGDGIPTANKTAWLHEPYEGGGNGHLLLAGDSDEARVAELHGMIAAAHQAGHQVGTHATGDRAVDAVVEACAAAQAAAPGRDPRHYVIHADLALPETLARMAELGIGANFNPGIKYLIADGQQEALGAGRSAYEWPYRTALDAGVVVASSSDAPVTDGNWRQGLATCVDRRGKQSGEVSGPEQRIDFVEALRTYTWAGAWQDHAETEKGTLEPGRVADLCILDARLDESDPSSYTSASVSATLLGGRFVFGDEEL